ncbi:MAG: hypothetical protein M1813_005003 [Trichoglossum hirsutum]|nr:MAG: hypothetical protein M1813_005003 [Trichoglossum hirsutum]
MQLTQLLVCVVTIASVATAATIPTKEVESRSLAKRGWCQAPGAHQCAVITAVGATDFPLQPASGQGPEVIVVGGTCDNLIWSGTLQPKSPGFYAKYGLAYGTTLEYHASFIGLGDIGGVWFTYNGVNYYQSQCSKGSDNSGPNVSEILQCNFPC